jgi:hypothetical protein
VPGISAPADRPLQWSADSRSLYVYNPGESRSKVWLVDVESGQRRLWKELPMDEALRAVQVRLTPDGKTWIVSGKRTLGELYLVDGLR